MNILYGTDNKYAPYTGVSLTSLFENNKAVETINVYIAVMDVQKENIEKFLKTAEKYGRKVVILDTSKAIKKIKEFKCGNWNGSIAAWLRFFVLEQIPDYVSEILWIDSDTVVENGIEEIFKLGIKNYEIAAVSDCLALYHKRSLDFKTEEPYYNSGVILFNLRLMRQNNSLTRMMQHLKTNAARYQIPDQDMMNVFFKNKIYKLSLKYNFQGFLLAYKPETYLRQYRWKEKEFYSKEELKEAINKPIIYHFFRFLGDYPWASGQNYHPCKDLYEKWEKQSLWIETPKEPGKKEVSFRIEKMLYRLLPEEAFLPIFRWYTNKGEK